MKQQSWKISSVRILNSGIRDSSDWQLAVDLIDEKLANGVYQVNYGPEGGIKDLIWGGATFRGLLKADELAEQLWRVSWQYRVLMVVSHACAFAGGVAIAFFGAWFQSWL
tara:strand:+ start:65614 stop:65943 length:330 start_codon:yes stop_codon:yes gene_type:complete